MRVALVHYWLINMRGGERVLEAFSTMFPDADIFCHVLDPEAISDQLAHHTIRTTFVNRLPLAKTQYQKYLPFMPRALEQLDLSAYDLVISSESGPAKGVIVRPDAKHLCYCHSPMRYIWDHYHQYMGEMGFAARTVFPHIAHRLRQWDVTSSARVDTFVANSRFVSQRIEKYYRRDSHVVFPPVDVNEFGKHAIDGRGEYYLAAGEFVGYKRFDLVVDACTRAGKHLIVVGDGDQKSDLERRAGPMVQFVGRVGFQELKDYMAGCKALIFPGEEDFGMVPVEVMATGRPVIAYGRGGALDTVIDGQTGIHFHDQSVNGLINAIERFETSEFDRDVITAHAATFSTSEFKRKMRDLIDDLVA